MVETPDKLADEIEDFNLDNIEDCQKLIEKYNFQLAASLKDIWVLKRMFQIINEKHLSIEVLNEINEEAVNELTEIIKGEFTDE